MKNDEMPNTNTKINMTQVDKTEREKFCAQRADFWNKRAECFSEKKLSHFYQSFLRNLYQHHIRPNQKVLEIGCGKGDLLASVSSMKGVGIDFSTKMIEAAKAKHPHLTFYCYEAHNLSAIEGDFDFVILSDLINDLYDVQLVLEQIKPLCHSDTRIIINFQSHFWSTPIRLVRKLGFAHDQLLQNWFTLADLKNLFRLCDYEEIKHSEELLFPIKVPLVSGFLNKCLARIWPFTQFCLTHFVVARLCPSMKVGRPEEKKSVSVVVAARNEEGHIQGILDRIPLMGSGTELIFVEGGSTDKTYETIEEKIKTYSRMPVRLLRQSGKGKGDAVRLGFIEAQNDILMILDADMTVMPEDLPRFYEALVSGAGDFINGVRLVYPMEDKAMRFLNLIGNKCFSMGFSYTLGQPIKDTLCGTKVLYRDHYEMIAKNRDYFGEFDPYGDFDLIFGAAKQHMKIVDLPIRYQARSYGDTNINRWEGGWLLLKMLIVALKKIKFV